MKTRKTFIIIARRFEINLKMVTRWIREYKDGKYGDIDITNVEILLPNGSFIEELKKLLGESTVKHMSI